MPSSGGGEVQPLRIQKSFSNNSMASPKKAPLSEISPMGIRRNSPSMAHLASPKVSVSRDSSPFDAAPSSNSPLSFWRGRENASPTRHSGNETSNNLSKSPSTNRRSSLERLQNASRVSNNDMLRGLQRSDSAARPPASSLINPWGAAAASQSPTKGHRRSQSKTDIPTHSSPLKRGTSSPQKSSLSSASKYAQQFHIFDAEKGTWSDDEDTPSGSPKTLRHPKSVSFDQAPPQINEYEQITPDPSSIASGSREGSYDSDAFDLDDSFEEDRHDQHDDSFDASLEDTERTPVVLPEDWSFMSPNKANTQLAKQFDDPFDERPVQSPTRSDSVVSNRPLPSLPKAEASPRLNTGRSRSDSKINTPRTLPTPPRPASVSKAEILGMREESPMPFDERLRLLALQQQVDCI